MMGSPPKLIRAFPTCGALVEDLLFPWTRPGCQLASPPGRLKHACKLIVIAS